MEVAFNSSAGTFWRLLWSRDICLSAFFAESFSNKTTVVFRPIEASSEARHLYTLKRSSDNPSASSVSQHMNFSTCFLESVEFVVAFLFFFQTLFGLGSSTFCWEACKMQNLLQTGLSYSAPSILYTWLVFNCYFWRECFSPASFFKVVSKNSKTAGCQIAGRIVSFTSAGYIAATQPSYKNWQHAEPMEKRHSTFHTFFAEFHEFVFEIVFFVRFSESQFSQNLLVRFQSLFAKLKAQTCCILWKSKITVSHVCDLGYDLFYLFFSPNFFFVFSVKVVFPQRLMVEVPLFNAILETSDAENMLSRLLLFHAFLILCMKCFPLSFVLRCSVLVAVSFLVSQGVCNAGVRVCFSDDFEKQTLLFFGILHSILSSFTWNMEFFCMVTFPKFALLKFTGWIIDFKGSFSWLQYGWSVT